MCRIHCDLEGCGFVFLVDLSASRVQQFLADLRKEKKALPPMEVGFPYLAEGPDGALYADFHSLRHSYVALLEKTGATLKQAMQLARHSDPRLTMARYGRAQLQNLGSALERMPALAAPQADSLRATGTEGA
jgi:integrase